MYYIETTSTDTDFEDNAYLYDDVFLDEFEHVVGAVGGNLLSYSSSSPIFVFLYSSSSRLSTASVS